MGDDEAPETIWETGTAVGFVEGREYGTVGRVDAGADVALPPEATTEPEAGAADEEAFEDEGAAAAAEPWRALRCLAALLP